MWPLPAIRYDHVIIHIDRSSFSLGWISSYKRQFAQLHAFQKHEFQALTHAQLSHALAHFIKRYQLTGALLSISMNSPIIYEELVKRSDAHATAQDFNAPQISKLLWDFRYLHPLSSGDHLFYVCGINRPTFFSCQLLATQHKMHIIAITSWYNTLIQAYKTIFGPAFRMSQLAIDMESTRYHLEGRLHPDSISRLLHIGSALTIDREQEKKALISMIGLYYQERCT